MTWVCTITHWCFSTYHWGLGHWTVPALAPASHSLWYLATITVPWAVINCDAEFVRSFNWRRLRYFYSVFDPCLAVPILFRSWRPNVASPFNNGTQIRASPGCTAYLVLAAANHCWSCEYSFTVTPWAWFEADAKGCAPHLAGEITSVERSR